MTSRDVSERSTRMTRGRMVSNGFSSAFPSEQDQFAFASDLHLTGVLENRSLERSVHHDQDIPAQCAEAIQHLRRRALSVQLERCAAERARQSRAQHELELQ